MLVLKFNNSLFMKHVFVTFFILAVIAGIGVAREIYVHSGSQADTADGSTTLPFKTIAEALSVVKAGDTVIVREGLYRESVRVPGGKPGKPVSLKAADGERVILSGAVPITEWKKHRDNVYVTVLDFKPDRLLVAYREQQLAREPNEGWWTTKAVDGLTITDTVHLKSVSPDFVGGHAYIWTISGNTFFPVPVESLDRINGRLTVVRESKWMQLAAGDRYFLRNHPSLIDSPGEWAVQEEGNKFRVYFQPATPADLDIVEAPRELRPILSVRGANHVSISGLEVVAGAKNGIEVMQAENVVISNCISHSHSFMGILLRAVKGVTVRHNISMHNSYGVVLHTTADMTVEENEIAYNTTDGLIVSWNSTDVNICRNYIHHHLLWGHPDNIQLYGDVKDINFIDNLLIASGQSMIMVETSDGLVKGNMIVGSVAYSLVLGIENYRIQNNTIAFSGYGCINFRGRDCDARENVLVTGHPGIIFVASGAGSYSGDHNLFYNAPKSSNTRVVVSEKGWHNNLAAYQRATGYDRNSKYGDPKFKNAPIVFTVVDARRVADCSRTTLHLGNDTIRFKVGDAVEMDFDGVLRKVTGRDATTITFSPALRAKPMKPVVVGNWADKRDLSLDLRLTPGSPGAKLGASGGPVGSTIDIAAYQRGDFNADGKRDLPRIPSELEPKNDREQDVSTN